MDIIRVENLGKRYRLGVINRGMLYKDIQSWWARITGGEDPNTPVIGLSNPGSSKANTNGSFWALRDVSFSIKPGEVIGVIGRNGAGKSTLLKLLSQITAPTEGAIKLNGRIASLLEVGTGFHGELTGRENIYLNGAILGMSRAEVRKKFEQIVEFAEIGKFVDTPVKRYSSGMYVRLAFSVAAHLDPDILVVDEVLAVGDANFQRKCLDRMDEAASKEGRTILFVSHNMSAVKTLCHRGILLEKGTVAMDGPCEEIVNHYLSPEWADKESFSNCRHFGTGRLRVTNLTYENKDGLPVSEIAAGDPVTFVVDYENISLTSADDVSPSISLHSEACPDIFHNYGHFSGQTFRNLPRQGKFRFTMSSLDMIPGEYHVRTRIIANGDPINGEILDQPLISRSLMVTPSNFFGKGHALTTYGLLLVRGDWRNN